MLWKTYSTILQSIPQGCGKLERYAVENSYTFPHLIYYLWKTILAIEYVPLALLAHEGNIKKKYWQPAVCHFGNCHMKETLRNFIFKIALLEWRRF